MVSTADIAIALGQPEPAADDPRRAQWSMWIDDALLLLRARFANLAELDQQALDYVVREAVTALARRPDDATTVEVAVDDGRESRTYSTGPGRVFIRPEWYTLLDPDPADKGAFAVDTVGTQITQHADICALRFGALYCSCGAVLTMLFPLYETGGY
jgi:hypothetical protein